MKAFVIALVMAAFSGSAYAHSPNLPYTEGKHFEFMHQDYQGKIQFHKPRFMQSPGEQTVVASFYGHGEKLNRYTASGQVFDPGRMTAAHMRLPLGTKVRVKYNGRSVVVVINDRGPNPRLGRQIDLSYGAARAIGLDRAGVGRVQLAVL